MLFRATMPRCYIFVLSWWRRLSGTFFFNNRNKNTSFWWFFPCVGAYIGWRWYIGYFWITVCWWWSNGNSSIAIQICCVLKTLIKSPSLHSKSFKLVCESRSLIGQWEASLDWERHLPLSISFPYPLTIFLLYFLRFTTAKFWTNICNFYFEDSSVKDTKTNV